MFELLLLRFWNENQLKKRIEDHKFILSWPSKGDTIVGLQESEQELRGIFNPDDEVNMSVILPSESDCVVCYSRVEVNEGRTQW